MTLVFFKTVKRRDLLVSHVLWNPNFRLTEMSSVRLELLMLTVVVLGTVVKEGFVVKYKLTQKGHYLLQVLPSFLISNIRLISSKLLSNRL